MLYICGDIQGKLNELVQKIIQENIKDSYIIVSGNIGAGSSGFEKLYEDKLESDLNKNNIKILGVRGNQDNPEWFDGKHDYSNLKFLEDYKQFEISGKTIYPIGGSISQNEKTYQEKEDITRENPEDFPVKSDILVTHEAPISFDPVILRDQEEELSVYEDILSWRRYLDTMLQEINVKSWYFGKYHKSYSGYFGKTVYHSLGELELCEVC